MSARYPFRNWLSSLFGPAEKKQRKAFRDGGRRRPRLENLEDRITPSVSFAPKVLLSLPTGSSPQLIAVGDFNHDKIPDIAVTDSSTNQVTVFVGTGGGNFAAGVNYTTVSGGFGMMPNGIAIGDVNNDGFPDIVTANGDGSITTLLNNGHGGFEAPIVTHTGLGLSGGLVGIAIGDFNNDGIKDVVVTAGSTNSVGFEFGNNTGVFGINANGFSTFTGFGSNPDLVTVANFNGHGDGAAVTNRSGSNVSVFLNDGSHSNGAIGAPATYAAGSNPTGIAAGDFNNDGHPDLAVANFNTAGTVNVLLNNGNGTFGTATSYPVGNSPVGIATADFNLDGNVDIVAADQGTSNDIALLQGNGNGTFQAYQSIGDGGGVGPQGIAAADVNGDTLPDLQTVNVGSDNMSVLLNTTTLTGNVVIPGTSGDTLVINATTSNSGTYSFDGGPAVAFGPVTSFTFNEPGGDGSMTINNPAGSLFAPTGGVFFNGGGGSSLADLGGTADSGSYTPNSNTPANSGTLSHTNGAVTQTISFTGLSPSTDTVSEGTFTINGTAAGEHINIVDGPVVGGSQTTQVNSTPDNTFELVNFANKTTVTVSGQHGADTITVNNPTPAAGLATLIVNGGATAGDIVDIENTPAGVTTNWVGGASATINVGNAGSVQGISGPVNLENPAPGAVNAITVDNSADTSGRTVTLGAFAPNPEDSEGNNDVYGQISGLAPAVINYEFDDSSSLLVSGGSGGNVFNVNSTISEAPAATTIDGGSGDDTFNIDAGGLGTDSTNTFNGQGGKDTFNVTNTLGGGATLNIDGGAPTTFPGDVLNVPDGSFVTPTGPGSGVVGTTAGASDIVTSYSSIENVSSPGTYALDINTTNFGEPDGGTPDTESLVRNGTQLEFRLDGVLEGSYDYAAISSLTLTGSSNDDTATVDFSGGDPVPAGGLTFDGSTGASNQLIVTGYSGVPVDSIYTGAHSGTVQVGAAALITYLDLTPLFLTGTASDLTIDLTQTGVANPDVVVGASGTAGESEITGSTFEATTFTDPSNSLTVDLGPDGDTITVQNMQTGFAPAGVGLADPFTINGNAGAQSTFNVQSTDDVGGGTYGSLRIIGANADFVNVGNATNGVQSIGSILNIENPPSLNRITIDDTADTTGRTATLSTFTPSVDGDHPAGGNKDPYGKIHGLSPADINYESDPDTNEITIDGGSGGNTFNVQSIGADLTTINTGSGDDTVNVSSDAGIDNPMTGNLSGIQTELDLNTQDGTDTVNISDYSAGAGQTYTLSQAGGPGATTLTSSDAALIVYDANGTAGQLENFNLIGSVTGGNTYNINNTSATVSNTFTDGDVTDPGSSTFNIQADQLQGGASNTFNGNGSGNTFNLNFAADASISAAAGTTVTVNGGTGSAGDRNVVNIDTTADNNPRTVGFTYPATTGGQLNISGLGTDPAGSGVQVLTTQEVNFFGGANNVDTETVTATGTGSVLSVTPTSQTTTDVFLNGTPEILIPTSNLNNPGENGGGTAPDLFLSGISTAGPGSGLFVNGGGGTAQLVVNGTTEDSGGLAATSGWGGFGMTEGNNAIPGFTTSTIQPTGDAYNSIFVSDTLVNLFNSNGVFGPFFGPGFSVNISGGFGNPSATNPGETVNSGDQVGVQANGVADDISVTLSTTLHILINGGLPTATNPGPNAFGMPQGDELDVTTPAEADVYSDADSPPHVSVNSITTGTQPVTYTSIERLNVSPGNGVVNLIGDNDIPGNDQNDYFKVRGGPDPFLSNGNANGVDQFSLQIGGSWDPKTGAVGTPDVNQNSKAGLSTVIWFAGVSRINASGAAAIGFDSSGNAIPDTSPSGKNLPAGINALDITPWANNNALNPLPFNGITSAEGWGIETYWNQGNAHLSGPTGDGGIENDLLVYNGMTGVSDSITIQPSAPQAGQVYDIDPAMGTSIAVVNYTNNSNIIVNASSPVGTVGDTDTLTINGTNPDNSTTSGNEDFLANFAATGDGAHPMVRVYNAGAAPATRPTAAESADTAGTAANILFNLQDFTNFSTINVNANGGSDFFDLISGFSNGGLTVNVDGGNPAGSGTSANVNTVQVVGTAAGVNSFEVTPGADDASGRITAKIGGATAATVLNFSDTQNIAIVGGGAGASDTLTLDGTQGNDTFALTGTAAGAGTARISSGPQVTFSSLGTAAGTIINLNGDGGTDAFTITQFASWAIPNININGNGNDTVTLLGTGTGDAYTYTPLGANSGTVADNIGTTTTYNLFGVGSLTIDARTPTLGTLSAVVPAADDYFINPGSQSDSGTFTVTTPAGLGQLLLQYRDIATVTPSTGTVAVVSAPAGGSITVSGTGVVTVKDSSGIIQQSLNLAATPQLDLNVTAGNITVILSQNTTGGALFSGGIKVIGGSSSTNGDVLVVNETLTGSPVLDFLLNTLTTIFTGPISFAGVGQLLFSSTASPTALSLANYGAPTNLTQVAINDNAATTNTIAVTTVGGGVSTINYTPVSGSAAGITRNEGGPAISITGFSNTDGDLTINRGGTVLAVNFQGSTNNDAITASHLANGGTHVVDLINGVVKWVPVDIGTGGAGTVLTTLSVLGNAGDDSLTVSDTGGALSLSGGVFFDGGTGHNTLILSGTTAATSDTYTPGPGSGQGSDIQVIGGLTQEVTFANLSPVIDLTTVAAGNPFTVNGTNAANSINYTVGPNNGSAVVGGATTGQVAVDGFETIEFANKNTLTINALAGGDTINLNDSGTPTGLTGITVVGSGSAQLILNNVPGVLDSWFVTPTGQGAGSASNNSGLVAPVTFSGVAKLSLVGQLADHDTFSIQGTTGNDAFIYTQGTTPDTGTITGSMDQNNATGKGPFPLVPISFSGMSETGPFANAINQTAPAGIDSLTFNASGPDNNVTLLVGAGFESLINTINGTNFADVNFANGASGRINIVGLQGNDTVTVPGNIPIPVTVDGAGPTSGDILNFNGTGAAPVTVDLGARTVQETGFAVVSFVGIATANVNAGGAIATVADSNAKTSLVVTPTGAATATVQANGAAPIVNVSGAAASGLVVSLGAGSILSVDGATSGQAFTATNTAVTVTGDIPVDYTAAQLAELAINGAGGSNSLIVDSTTGAVTTPIVYNGGAGTGNSLTLTGGTATKDVYTPGAATGAGNSMLTFASGTENVTFSNLSPLYDNVAGPLTVNGTNANNAISYGEGNDTTGAVNPAWGQVSVDGFEPINFTGKTTLTIGSLKGTDTVILDNANRPTGLTGITVNGGDLSASDTLTVTSFGDPLVVEPTAQGAGNVNYFSGSLPNVTYTGIGNLHLQQNAGALPAFGVDGTTGNDVFQYFPGATPDTGTVLGTMNGGAFTLPTITFSGVNQPSFLRFNVFGQQGGSDTFVFHGTASSETIGVGPGVDGVVISDNANGQLFANLSLGNLANLIVDTGAGQDTVNYTGISVPASIIGGDPAAGDIVNMTGATGAVTISLTNAAAATPTTVTGYGGTVTLTGIDVLNANAGANATTVDSTTTQASLSVTPTGPNAATITQAGVILTVNVTNTGAQTLTIDGNALANTVTVNGTSGNDTINVVKGATTTVQVNGFQTISLPAASDGTVIVAAGDGNDTINVSGTIDNGQLLDVQGRASGALDPQASDTLNIAMSAAGFTEITQAASVDSGEVLDTPTGGATTITEFSGIQNVGVTGLAGGTNEIQADGTDSNDTITLSNDGGGNEYYVNSSLIVFANYQTADIAGNFGDDVIKVVPTTLVGVSKVQVFGSVSSVDSLEVFGNSGANAVTYTPGDPGTPPSVAVTSGGVTVPVDFNITDQSVASVAYIGTRGGDALTIDTTNLSGNQTEVLTPGSTFDSGHVDFRDPGIADFAPGGTPLDFSGLGVGGSVTFADTAGMRDDNLIYNGTSGNDTFTATPTGDVTLNTQLVVHTPSMISLTLAGLSGNDVFNVPGNNPFATSFGLGTPEINVEGAAGSSSTLNFTGDGKQPVTVNVSTQTVTETTFAPVTYSGVATLNVAANGAAFTVDDTTDASSLAVTPTGAATVSVQTYSGGTAQNSQGGTLATMTAVGPVINASGVSTAAGGFTINGNGGSDQLFVEGTQNADVIDVNDATSGANAVAVNALLVINYSATFAHLEIDALAGSDTINIQPSATTTFLVDGGDPIGVKPGDTLNLIHPAGDPYTLFPGPTSDSGGLSTSGLQTISWIHIETVINTGPGGPALILGTNGNDEITVIARDSSYNPAAPGTPNPLLDGVQDFTVSVNDGPDMLFINTPNLFIDSLSGNDDIVVREPAPNQAVWDVQVFVAAGPPASGANRLGDNIELETPGTQSVTYNPDEPASAIPPVAGVTYTTPATGGGQFHDTTNASTVTATEFLFPAFYQSSPGGAENFIYAGEAGNDTLTYNTPANSLGSNLVYTPGANPDAGTITGTQAGGSDLTPLTFSDLGTTGGVAFTTSNTANTNRTDTLNVEDSAAGDTFLVNGTNGGTIKIIRTLPTNTNLVTVPITAAGILVLELDGLGGNDTFNIAGSLPFTNTTVDDGSTVDLSGATGAVTVNLADSTIPTNTTITGYGAAPADTVTLIGVDTANLNAGGFAVTVNGTPQPDSIVYTPTATNAGTLTNAGLDTVFNFSTVSAAAGGFTIDAATGSNTVTVNGTAGSDNGVNGISVARATTNDVVTVGTFLPASVVSADTASLVVATGNGADTVTVSGTGGPTLTVQGGQIPAGDTLVVNNTVTSGGTMVTPGATNDSGTVANADGTIKFSGMTLVTVNDNVASTTNALTVLGTNGDDAITTARLGTNNVVWVNAQAVVTFTGFNQLILNGKFGNDTFAVSPVGLTFVGATPKITVMDVTLGNSLLTVNGSAVAAADTFNYEPTSATAGTVAITTPANVAPVVFTNVSSAAINGQGGNDTLTYTSPANANAGSQLAYAPGANPDSGTITGTQVGGSALVPLTFSNLGTGAGATVSFTTANTVRADHLIVQDLPGGVGDVFNVAPGGAGGIGGGATGTVNILHAAPNSTAVTLSMLLPGVSVLELDGLTGSDTFNVSGTAAGNVLPFSSLIINDGTTVNLGPAAGPVSVFLGDNTPNSANPNTVITGYGAPVTLIGVDTANLDATANALSAVGTSQNDDIVYTPSGATAGTFYDNIGSGNNLVPNTVFNMVHVTGNFTVFGGSAGNADEVTVRGSDARDLFEINQGTAVATVLANNVTTLLPVQLSTNVSILTALGLGGEDTFQVIPAAGIGAFPQDNLLINVDGGTGGANNALVLGSSFAAAGAGTMGVLPATSFVVDNRGDLPNTRGTVRVYQSAVANPDINYQNIQTFAPNVAQRSTGAGVNTTLSPNLLVMGPDNYESDDTQGTAAFLGSGSTLQIQNASIFPNNTEFPGAPSDQDYYRVVAQTTGTLDFQVYFNQYPTTLLPGGGTLLVDAFDVNGHAIAASAADAGAGTGATSPTFTTIGTTANARIRIPVVQGQTYYLHVYGTAAGVVNGYNATIINTAPPVPSAIELSRSVISVTVTTPGSGYTSPPTVTIKDSAGHSIQGTAYMTLLTPAVGATPATYAVSSITVGEAVGFVAPLTVTISAPPAGGTQAVATAAITDTGDEPGTAVNDDSGRSQLDNVTNVNTPFLYVRVDDAGLLQDLPGNQTNTTGTPIPGGNGPIAIPFDTSKVPADLAAQGALTAGYRVALFDGGDGAPVTGTTTGQGGVDHTLDPNDPTFIGFASQVPDPNNPGHFIPGLYVLQVGSQGPAGAPDSLADGIHNITAEVQIIDPANPTQTAFGGRSEALQLTVDTVPPPVSFGTNANNNNGLAAGSDSGKPDDPITLVDDVTNVTDPVLYGTAEANAIIKVYAQINQPTNPNFSLVPVFPTNYVLIGQTVATPFDGTNADPDGRWSLQSNINLNDPLFFTLDGLRTLVVTGEDLAGNVSKVDTTNTVTTLQIFVDTQGPQINGVQVTGVPGYNLFALKPTNFTEGPTPLIHSLTILVIDNPPRVAPFLNDPALDVLADSNPGLYSVVGDQVGIIPIQSVTIDNMIPATSGMPAMATITLTFGSELPQDTVDGLGTLPDDRYTLTISDEVQDTADNDLDGESNASMPLGNPTFPSGNGVPGGDFVARFTVDSRPHLGIDGNGVQQLDVNGNGIYDPVNAKDAVNEDKSFRFGLYTDNLFGGNFAPAGSLGTMQIGLNGAILDGYDQLGAYGQVNGQWRWLLSFSGVTDTEYSVVSGLQINGLPVAGQFNPNIPHTDEIGVFDGNGNWYIDYNHTNNITASSMVIHTGMRGYPVVGDFDGDGNIDLATYQPDTNTWQFDLDPLTSHSSFQTLNWGFPGILERPVAQDMNRDGVTDIGLFVPTSLNSTNNPGADWYFLLSQGTPVTGTINTLAHTFDDSPFSSDLYYHFGNGFFQPIVGLWDPPMPAATNVLKLAAGSFTDVDVSAELGSVPANGFTGLIARESANNQNAYWGGLVHTGNSYSAQIRLLLNGSFTTLASTPFNSFAAGDTLSFEVVGTTLELSVNGDLVATAADSHLQASGKVGSYSSPNSSIWPAMASPVVHSTVSLPYSDSFSQPDGTLLGTNWNQWTGSFRYQGGAAVGQATTDIATLFGVTANDITLSAAITSVPAGGFAGLISRYDPATGNMYRAGLAATYDAKKKVEDYTAQLWRKQGGKWTLLASAPVSGPGELTFVTAGTSLELFLNDTLVVHAGDSKLKTGSAGLYATKGAALTNFSASPPVLALTSLPFSDTFSTGAAPGPNWYSNVGAFSVANGALQALAANSVLTLDGVSQLNVSVQAQILNVPAGTSAGLLARYNAATGNTYMADIASTYNARTKTTTYTAQIQRRVKGVWKVLFSTSVAHLGTLSFSVVGNQLSLYLNTTPLATITDGMISGAGTVGVTGGVGSQLGDFMAGAG